MKFIADKLPFYEDECTFECICAFRNDSEVCPRHWDKYDIENRKHECPWLEEQVDEQE